MYVTVATSTCHNAKNEFHKEQRTKKKFTKRPLYIGIYIIYTISSNKISKMKKNMFDMFWKWMLSEKPRRGSKTFLRKWNILRAPFPKNKKIKRTNVKVCWMCNRIKDEENKWKCDDSNSDSISRRISIFFRGRSKSICEM